MCKNKGKLNKNYIGILKEFEENPNDFFIVSEATRKKSQKMLTKIERKSHFTKWSKELLDTISEASPYGREVYGHSLNVGLLSAYIAAIVGNDESEITTAFYCGLMHDIGKLDINKETLFKTSELDKNEKKLIQEHTIYGYRKLQNGTYKNPSFEYHLRNTALQHHERVDGKGYPLGITGKDIDYFAKIVMIADVYDALTQERCYHPKYSSAEALDIMEREKEGYDRELFDCFVENVRATVNSEDKNK